MKLSIQNVTSSWIFTVGTFNYKGHNFLTLELEDGKFRVSLEPKALEHFDNIRKLEKFNGELIALQDRYKLMDSHFQAIFKAILNNRHQKTSSGVRTLLEMILCDEGALLLQISDLISNRYLRGERKKAQEDKIRSILLTQKGGRSEITAQLEEVYCLGKKSKMASERVWDEIEGLWNFREANQVYIDKFIKCYEENKFTSLLQVLKSKKFRESNLSQGSKDFILEVTKLRNKLIPIFKGESVSYNSGNSEKNGFVGTYLNMTGIRPGGANGTSCIYLSELEIKRSPSPRIMDRLDGLISDNQKLKYKLIRREETHLLLESENGAKYRVSIDELEEKRIRFYSNNIAYLYPNSAFLDSALVA